MKPIRRTCTPREEVLKGDLEDAIFAADFGHVVEHLAPDVYKNPVEFFRNTHPAAPLKKVVTTIFGRLADPMESGAAVRLSTGYGGGKTHTLIALWHLAHNIDKTTIGTELLPAAGRPQKVIVAGIDASKFGTKVCATHDNFETHSLWGEMAFQLGGKLAYNKLKNVDDPTALPNDSAVRAMLPNDPTLILLDELVIYMAALEEQARGTLLAFLRVLIAEVGARKQAVIVITDPAGQAGYQKEAQALADATKQMEAARRLDDIQGRKMTDYDPIGNESAQVINRRLFDKVDYGAAEIVSAEYYNAYKRISSEYPDLLPPDVATQDYAKRIVECYPFHPRLLETARDRLGALQDFNKSRGTLRLFARILRDTWESKSEVPLITAGDLDWTSARIQADLLQRLNKDSFKPAVDADVVHHAGQLDSDFGTDIHRRVASALLLESLPMTPSAAMDKRDLSLAVLRPSDVGHEAGEAIDRLMSNCWHTYKDDSGRKYQFRFEPNINKLIEERAESIHIEDVRPQVFALAQQHFNGRTFDLKAYPGSPRTVADSASLKLVLCDSEQLAQAICDYEDDSEPEAKRPRRFRNAIFGIAPTSDALSEAVAAMRVQSAATEIAKEQRRNTPLKQQVDELLPVLRKRAKIRSIRAFNRVVFQGKSSVTLDEKYLVSEESALESVSGQAKLKEFLDDKKMVYQQTDSLDVDLLLDSIMKGATPSLDYEGAFPASAVHERALSHEKLRLMMNESPVRNSVLRAVDQGKLVVRQADGDAYDDAGLVTGGSGNRKRVEGRKLNTLLLTSDVLFAPKSAPCVSDWLRVDEEGGVEYLGINDAAAIKFVSPTVINAAIADGQLNHVTREGATVIISDERFKMWQPAAIAQPIAYDWDEAIKLASIRPLRSLTMRASTPDGAKQLVTIAQPFGAKSLTQSVKAGGRLKDGGIVNFVANGLKHNHPLKPNDMAATLLRAVGDGANFEAELKLDFGDDGMTDTASKLELARSIAKEEVKVVAEFGEEQGS